MCAQRLSDFSVYPGETLGQYDKSPDPTGTNIKWCHWFSLCYVFCTMKCPQEQHINIYIHCFTKKRLAIKKY